MAETIVHKVDLSMLLLQELSVGKQFRRQLATLKDAIKSLRAKLVDSQVSATMGPDKAAFQDWLNVVRSSLYDIEHFVDIIYAPAASTARQRHNSSLLSFTLSRLLDFYLNYRFSAWKIRDMRGKFINQFADNAVLNAAASYMEPRSDQEETYPLLSAVSLVGRKSERNAINRMLTGDPFSAVFIYGMEGLGKTTVAQLVCLRSPGFDHCFWVWVGNELNPTYVISKVFKTVSAQIQALATKTTPIKKLPPRPPSMTFTAQILAGQSDTTLTEHIPAEQLGTTLTENIPARQLSISITEHIPAGQLDTTCEDHIRDKKLLLVLDDVRILDEKTLVSIRDSSMFAGSTTIKVVITTRSKQLATANYEKVSTNSYELGAISDEDAWTLFKKVAFNNDQDPELLDLGWEMMKRTNNVPRTIMDLASLVNGKDKRKWKALMNADFSRLREAYSPYTSVSDLAFRLLPSPLKRCFAYSAFLFQQNDNIEMHQLIHLWIAQGYIEEPVLDGENQTLEEVSEDYYKALQDWSFFRDHKLDFDLAKSIAASEMLAINIDCAQDGSVLSIEVYDCKGIYHLFISNTSSLTQASTGPSHPPSGLLLKHMINSLPPRLRSFLKAKGSTVSFTTSICDQLFSSMVYLRALDLNSSNIIILPASIGLLEHLRYLNLSINDFIKLPNSITTLAKLQVLNLSSCEKLIKLPTHFSRLISLRHLYLDGCEGLAGMPVRLSKMTALQTLNLFVLGNTQKSCKLGELSNLNLKSELTYRFASQ